MSFSPIIYAPYGAEKVTGATKYHPLGTGLELPDGRRFRYAQNGASTLGAGNLVQAQAAVEGGNHDTDVTISTAVGDYASGQISTGKTSVGIAWTSAGDHSSGVYVDGYLNVETSPGYGLYRVSKDESTGGSSGGASGHSVLVLDEHDKLRDILTTVSKLSLQPNLYASVIVTPAGTPTGVTVGVAPADVAASEYFWVQTRGLASVDYDDAISLGAGRPVSVGSTVAGAVQGLSSLATTVQSALLREFPVIGIASTGIPDDADRITVMLTLE